MVEFFEVAFQIVVMPFRVRWSTTAKRIWDGALSWWSWSVCPSSTNSEWITYFLSKKKESALLWFWHMPCEPSFDVALCSRVVFKNSSCLKTPDLLQQRFWNRLTGLFLFIHQQPAQPAGWYQPYNFWQLALELRYVSGNLIVRFPLKYKNIGDLIKEFQDISNASSR